MTLQAYLTETGTSRAQFAERLGVSVESVRRYLSGRRPEWAIMDKIVLVTAGKVTANDFLGVAA